MDIPNPIRVTTGEQHTLSEIIDNFFLSIKKHVEEKYKTEEKDFSIKSGEIAYNPLQVTDDRITYLSYKERPIALVIETRTEANHISYAFFRNLENLGTEVQRGFC